MSQFKGRRGGGERRIEKMKMKEDVKMKMKKN
jgi:hypothetical protein